MKNRLVRVIAGIARGRRLKVPRGWPGRPTADRVKESLFNILGSRVYQSRFLDLFAGTGNVGIEALSRGAGRAVLVEKDPRAIRVIYENLSHVGLLSKALVLKQDVFFLLKHLGESGEHFDLIFLDPPYGCSLEVHTLELIDMYRLLLPGGLAIVESAKKEVLPSRINNLILTRQERYGDTLLTFYANSD